MIAGDKIAGFLEVGTNDKGEVVINHPDLKPDADGIGHIVFSSQQARTLAAILNRKAVELDGGTAQERTAAHEEWVVAKATRAALGKAMEVLKAADKALCAWGPGPNDRFVVADIRAILADPTGKAALDEWVKVQAVIDAAAAFARMAPPWGNVDRYERLEAMRDVLAAIGLFGPTGLVK